MYSIDNQQNKTILVNRVFVEDNYIQEDIHKNSTLFFNFNAKVMLRNI